MYTIGVANRHAHKKNYFYLLTSLLLLLLLLLLTTPLHNCFIHSTMESLYSIPFQVLEVPNLKLKKPSFLRAPSSMQMFGIVLVSYFLVTGGLIYDVIVEPPSIGSTTDEFGHSKPVAFMQVRTTLMGYIIHNYFCDIFLQYRVNGQYIMEGLVSSFLFVLGALGFIILERSNLTGLSRFNRIMLMSFGFFCVIISFIACRVFMTIKLPYVIVVVVVVVVVIVIIVIIFRGYLR